MNNGPHWRAAELHDLAAHAHRAAATHDDQTGHEHSKQAMEHSARAYRYSQEAHQEFKSSAIETGQSVGAASGPNEEISASPKAAVRRPSKRVTKTTKTKKSMNRKRAPKKTLAKPRAAAKKAGKIKQARIEMEFMGPTEELGKLEFDLFQAKDLKTGYAKAIAQDAKIELMPTRMSKGAPSVVVLLTVGLDVPESVASNYLWHHCGKFSKSREIKVLVNGTEYVYNERELRNIIKATIEKEAKGKIDLNRCRQGVCG